MAAALRLGKAALAPAPDRNLQSSVEKGSWTYGNLDDQNCSEYELCSSYHCILTVNMLMMEENGRVCFGGGGGQVPRTLLT